MLYKSVKLSYLLFQSFFSTMFDIYHHVIYSDIVQDTFQVFHVIVLEPANIGA